jgi:hypothetical protein
MTHHEQNDVLALGIADIRSCQGGDYIEDNMVQGRDAEGGTCADERRSEVEAAAAGEGILRALSVTRCFMRTRKVESLKGW